MCIKQDVWDSGMHTHIQLGWACSLAAEHLNNTLMIGPQDHVQRGKQVITTKGNEPDTDIMEKNKHHI